MGKVYKKQLKYYLWSQIRIHTKKVIADLCDFFGILINDNLWVEIILNTNIKSYNVNTQLNKVKYFWSFELNIESGM